jgi:RNA polymerase sigma-70 factor, ECF subfamily
MVNAADIQPPDEELMARTALGERLAFETLVLRHERSVLNLIYRFLGDRNRAEDLAQEAFLRVWQAANGYKPSSRFTTWMYRIVANLCLDELKSAWRKRLVLFHAFTSDDSRSDDEGVGDFSDGAPSPEDLVLSKERSDRVAHALKSLPRTQRLALILNRYDGLSYDEIAKVLGCSVSAVDSLLVRGKRNLQKQLAEH